MDYGLLDAAGTLIGNPVHYRDARTEHVRLSMPAAEIYAITGIQQLPINTLCQLTAAAGSPELAAARTLLLLPDLLGYWLTGAAGAEVTNASTTQLLDVRTRQWATGLMARAGIPPAIFPPLRQPGEPVGAPAARAGGAGRAARWAAGARRRLARHGIGGRRHAGGRRRLRVHLIGNVVTGRTRAHRASPEHGQSER